VSYATHAAIAYSPAIRGRVTACAAQEGADDPPRWAAAVIWKLIGSDWLAAWESYEAAHPQAGDDVGEHPDVITDQIILSAVQAAMRG
jgi:hypothetical protein